MLPLGRNGGPRPLGLRGQSQYAVTIGTCGWCAVPQKPIFHCRILLRVPSGGTTRPIGASATRMAWADAATRLLDCPRLTAISPSQRISGPNGQRNSCCLPIP